MLGIVIGIGSVIALISLGQGSQKAIENQIQSLGSNLITVIPAASFSGSVRGAGGSSTTLTLEDAEAIRTSPQVTTIVNISPELTTREQIIAGRNNTNTQIAGVTNSYPVVRKLNLDSGSFISETDNRSFNKVAVLGPQVVIDLFGENSNPIGQSIRISGMSFRIIGVTTSKGGSGFLNQDDIVFIPLSVLQKQILGVSHLNSIALEAASPDVMQKAQTEVGFLLLARHKISDPASADFSFFSQNDILSAASQTTSTFTALLGGIAAISLVVGGIGIMNIMLVTVTERTREIGLRKALGAKRKVIIFQFLLEALVLTIIGGAIGVSIGVAVSFFLSQAFSLPFAIYPASILLALGVSSTIGIIFGWYPARKASQLQPIEALRYE
jgi:putative ABC transport system permease protein